MRFPEHFVTQFYKESLNKDRVFFVENLLITTILPQKYTLIVVKKNHGKKLPFLTTFVIAPVKIGRVVDNVPLLRRLHLKRLKCHEVFIYVSASNNQLRAIFLKKKVICLKIMMLVDKS